MSKYKITDPVFPMTFLINSWIPGMIDALAQATFLSALLLFWLCVYHGLRQVFIWKTFWAVKICQLLQNERRLLTFYFPKFFIVGMLWISAVIMATWEKCNELTDPTYNHAVDTTHYYVSLICFFLWLVNLNFEIYRHSKYSSLHLAEFTLCTCSFYC